MPDHKTVYQEQAEQYEVLISREDYEHSIPRKLEEIHTFSGVDMVDVGAGTGRLSCMFASTARSIVAMDSSQSMLDVIQSKLDDSQLSKLRVQVSDLRSIPLVDSSADVITAGWTICYIASSDVENWRDNLATTILEMKRVVRKGGAIIILETLGTGVEVPFRPETLGDYYTELEQTYGFSHDWIRTDYKFKSVEEAERLTRFFFGDGLTNRVKQQQTTIVPECTGVWWLEV